MGYVDLYIDSSVGNKPFSTDALLSAYFEQRVGSEITIRVRSGDEITHQAILDVINGSAPAAYGTEINGTGWYIDRVRPNSFITSPIVGVDPINLPEIEGVWGVCTGGDDLTRIPGSNREIEFNLFVLARYGEYTDISDVESNLKVSVP